MFRSSKYRPATRCDSLSMASVFTSVRNIAILTSSTCSGFRRLIVARRNAQRERAAAPDLALDANRAVELLDDPLRDGQAEAQTTSLRRDEFLEDGRQPIGRNAGAGVGDVDLHVGSGARGRDRHAAAGFGRLNP